MTALTVEQGRRLVLLQGRPTRYEVAVVRAKSGERRLVAYVARRSKSGICAAITGGSRARDLIDFVCGSPRMTAVSRRGQSAVELRDGGVLLGTVEFTGRTQRDAICEGELSYLGNVMTHLRGIAQ